MLSGNQAGTAFWLALAAVVACGGSSRQEASAAETVKDTTSVSATASPPAAAAVQGQAHAQAGDFRDPAGRAFQEPAPAVYRVKFETSTGDFVIEVHRDWAPLGADRFYNLARTGFFDSTRFFRVLPGFMAQFGMHGDPAVSRAWVNKRLTDDPVRQSNTRGKVSFATSGPNSRTTQLFINYGDNARLDGMGFSPFGEVVEGMDVVERLYSGYGEGAPQGRGPNQAKMMTEGNAYLEKEFAKLDYVKRATVVAGN